MNAHEVAALLFVVGIALALLVALLATGVFIRSDVGPSVRARSLPSLPGLNAEHPTAGALLIVTVAGRAYEVTDGSEAAGETCPWCLGPLDGEPPSEVVRCDRPYCRQAAHRRHNLEGGGCGGMCSIAG